MLLYPYPLVRFQTQTFLEHFDLLNFSQLHVIQLTVVDGHMQTETGNMCLDIIIWVGIHFILALTLEYAQWKRAYMQWARSMGVDTIANKKTLFVTLVGHAD